MPVLCTEVHRMVPDWGNAYIPYWLKVYYYVYKGKWFNSTNWLHVVLENMLRVRTLG